MSTSFASRMFLAIATASLLAAPALADGRHPSDTKSAKAKKPNMGDSFDIFGPRKAVRPEGDDDVSGPLLKTRPRALSDAQVSRVVTKRLGDVQNCWNRLPSTARRTDTTAVLKLSVQVSGAVASVDVGGEVPAYTQKCIAAAAGRWTFPAAEVQSDVEYAVALRAM